MSTDVVATPKRDYRVEAMAEADRKPKIIEKEGSEIGERSGCRLSVSKRDKTGRGQGDSAVEVLGGLRR
ncbi:uncharacterized protein DS421_3g73920 [Arachis hypogaea]|nr:uncharacterized protein DS421_3g73920 [Arachis hypogaea]